MTHDLCGISGGVEEVKIDKLLILLAAPAGSNQHQTVVSGTPWLRRGWLTSDLVKSGSRPAGRHVLSTPGTRHIRWAGRHVRQVPFASIWPRLGDVRSGADSRHVNDRRVSSVWARRGHAPRSAVKSRLRGAQCSGSVAYLCVLRWASSRLEEIMISQYGCGASSARGISPCFRAAELGRNRQLADLFAHILTDLCREAIMKPGIDTCIGNFVAVVVEPAPFARYAGRSGAGQRISPTSSPTMFRRTVEIAAEVMQCAHGYSGCIGVSPSGNHDFSRGVAGFCVISALRIAVTGRQRLY